MRNRDKKVTRTPAKWVFVVLRLIVILILIRNFMTGNYENVFTCFLTLVLFVMPYVIEKKFKIEIPDSLEIIILLFI